MTSSLPKTFGRYETLQLIGEGAMGRVYKGFDPLMRRVVAIKTLKVEHVPKETAEDYLRRFRREAQAAGSLSHPHILSIFDVGENYFVMEFLEGTTLQALLREKGRLEVAEALRLLASVADALDYLHRSGIIHRDIKPANIMVLTDGRAKLMDFGVAHLESSVLTAAGEVFGSPSYMAPEQISGAEVTPGADLFSFAVVTYEAITGQKPFQGSSVATVVYRVVHEDPPPPRRYNADLPERFDEAFAKALSKSPAGRYPNATAFIAALELKEVDVAFSPEVVPPERAPVPPTQGAASPPEPFHTEATIDLSGPHAPRGRRLLVPLALTAGALGLVAAVLPLLRAPSPPIPSPPAIAGLRVETDPTGGTVFLDGKEAGHSPLALFSVAPGMHTLRVVQEGFAPTELSLEVVPGTTLAPLRFALQPIAARVDLASAPEGASVQVDGKGVGETPLPGLVVDPGQHVLRVAHAGFKAWTRTLNLKAGESMKLAAHLEAGSDRKARAAPTKPLREGDLVEPGPDVTDPVKISGENVSYPPLAVRARMQGAVTVEMIVTELGEPTDVRVVESAGDVLDAAVLDAVKRWRFEPARKNGIKVKVRWRFRQHFERKS